MKDPRSVYTRTVSPSLMLILFLLVFTAVPAVVTAQNNFAIPQGSLIIAMDNYRQGNDVGPLAGTGDDCAGPEFNIRAYGYAVRLLHQSVKLRWIINNTKVANTTNDIAGINVTQLPVGTYGGQSCTQTPATGVGFAGGPLVITPEYADTAKSLLQSFNTSTGGNNDVRVYEVTSVDATVPNAYVTEITHKPFVAVGPDCAVSSQCLSNSVYERLYAAAGLQVNTHYAPVSNDTFSNYCVTLAAQAHAQADAAANLTAYSNHVSSGGNLMLQCLSADIYDETVLAPNVRYFTSGGISNDVYAGNPANPGSSPSIDAPAQPFSQFVGALGRANGYTDYTGTFLGSTTTVSRYIAGDNRRIAMTRDILPGEEGGQVFGLGGHEYGGYAGDSVDEPGGSGPIVRGGELARVNGSRMALNALLVPAKPDCASEAPAVQGYKTVRLGTDPEDDLFTPDVINLQDTVQWIVRYINTGDVNVFNFQIKDTIAAGLEYEPGSLTAIKIVDLDPLTTEPVPTNAGFDGDTDVDMLGENVTLEAGTMITVRFKTKVTQVGPIANQATATGVGIQTPVQTDSADAETPGSILGFLIRETCGDPGLPPCYPQTFWVPGDDAAAIDPTYIDSFAGTTAADVEISGRVTDSYGRGIAREQITLQDAASGERKYVMTNTFGYFRFTDVPVGGFYLLTVNSKRYTYETPSLSFNLQDNLSDVRFVASRTVSKGISSLSPVKRVISDAKVVEPAVVLAAPVETVKAPTRRKIVVKQSKSKVSEEEDEDKVN